MIEILLDEIYWTECSERLNHYVSINKITKVYHNTFGPALYRQEDAFKFACYQFFFEFMLNLGKIAHSSSGHSLPNKLNLKSFDPSEAVTYLSENLPRVKEILIHHINIKNGILSTDQGNLSPKALELISKNNSTTNLEDLWRQLD